ncbi:SDR family NAD(P)-dependent oxidoreductase [Methylobacterium organophilum]|uniref:Oxidoreductase n=1 Tax=Methylobacterium organophilum TaxID=410 RepID=A0ABQ4TBI9_METOR|nr:SDR family NAD(P)-dependent oxidoreductase [Methylobacterium organophilum]GJE28678.1 putative oxidoreductase [Methylobacterium organophilum]
MVPSYQRALIVGAGPGLSGSLARLFSAEGMRVGLAARNVGKLDDLARETGAAAQACDATDPAEVEALFARMEPFLGGAPDVVVYNASDRLRGPVADLDPEAVAQALMVSAYGGFLVTQAAARRMLPHRHGAILLTGASASVKGFAGSAPFAMGKFALRGLGQSLARELQPKGIHVAHVVIDGAIRSAARLEPEDAPNSTLDPDAIAKTYLGLLRQDRSAWATEIAVRPWVERF